MGPYGMDLSVEQLAAAEAGGAPDWAEEMRALVASHPTLTWLPPAGDGPHRAVWMEDDGPHREARDDLPELVQYLKARLAHARV